MGPTRHIARSDREPRMSDLIPDHLLDRAGDRADDAMASLDDLSGLLAEVKGGDADALPRLKAHIAGLGGTFLALAGALAPVADAL